MATNTKQPIQPCPGHRNRQYDAAAGGQVGESHARAASAGPAAAVNHALGDAILSEAAHHSGGVFHDNAKRAPMSPLTKKDLQK